eukprot:TRINITY_DN3430_c0_g2_i2.p1 TRINITY_DN3430_c0_g2~~TRINITY_DN3430_c0_g2_i2.p1  ORF type:complete len:499 (+),score=185.44 TRINITY_DN3430_c0_g2_i2:128-1498(+)
MEVSTSHVVPPKGAKFAWATIFYEAGRNDAEYFLGARVLMQSAKDSNTEADRVVLIADGTNQKYARVFESDGLKLEWVKNINSPWLRTQPRFAFALNKLKIWSMTQYERVIFLDADVILMQHADFLFNCGHFCAVFFNPINFHTAILVVKPDRAVYDDMVNKIETLGSFDGADQGFINAYFKGLNAANEWTKQSPPSNDRMNRLPVSYNMHHIYYYEKMSWGGPWGSAENIVTMTYPIAQFGKPWCWWGYPMMDMHFHWLRYRNKLDGPSDYPLHVGLLVLAPIIHFILTQVLKRCQVCKSGVMSVSDAESQRREGVWFMWGRGSCVAVTTGFGLSAVSMMVGVSMAPGILPPVLGWAVFITYYTLTLYHLACFVWLRAYGTKLRLENIHFALFTVPWLAFFISASYPYYPHGVVKLLWLFLVFFLSTGCNAALYKMVYDSNATGTSGRDPRGAKP